jgi:ABC-type lipoprotein release transport system permease subunit
MMGALTGKTDLPVDEVLSEFSICGIMKSRSQFGPDGFGGNLFVPVNTARLIPQLGFTSVWDLLDDRKQEGTHASIHVKLEGMEWMDPVKAGLEEMGVGVFTITDQLSEIRRVFLILNAALGFIGAIALLVAGLGITNTMVMSILERTREIGIMKSIGGSERQIMAIFFVEASAIGVVGALFGLVLGWAVTLLANYVMNTHVIPEGTADVDLFYFPLWLIFGAIAFAIAISLIAGLYPAIRASRVDPVKALRHD